MTPTINVPITYTTITVPVQTQTIYAAVTNGISTPSSIGTGTVTGPSSSVANNFASFLDTKGQIIKDSGYNAGSFLKQGSNVLTQDLNFDGAFNIGFGQSTPITSFNINAGTSNLTIPTITLGAHTTIDAGTNEFDIKGGGAGGILVSDAPQTSYWFVGPGDVEMAIPVLSLEFVQNINANLSTAKFFDGRNPLKGIQYAAAGYETTDLSLTSRGSVVPRTLTTDVQVDGLFNLGFGQSLRLTSFNVKAGTFKFLPTVAPIVGQVITATNIDGSWTWQNAGGSPGGSNTQIQFNNSSAFDGNSNFTINNGTGVVTFGQPVTIPLNPIASTDAASKGYVDGLTLGLPITPNFGGTGVTNNVASTITISGAFATTFTVTATTSVTLPTSGTLLANPMTTAGDIILGGASGAGTRLAIGANTFILTSNGTTAAWAAASGGGWAVIGSTTITGNTSQTGAFTESFLMNEVLITQNALSSGWVPALLITPGAHTAMTASTEFVAIGHATFTQTWLAGTIATQRFAYFRSPTIAGASASNTVTNAYNFYIDPPIQGTNAILTRKWALGLGGDLTLRAANSNIAAFQSYTDESNFDVIEVGYSNYWQDHAIIRDGKTAGSRVGGIFYIVSSGSNGSIKFATGASNRWIVNPLGHFFPSLTNTYDIGFDSSGGGNIARYLGAMKAIIGTNTVPAALLDIAAGTAVAGTAPLHFASGVNLTTAVAGTMEYNGTNLFFTRTGTTRENVLIGNDAAGAPATTASPVFTSFYGGNTKTLGDPNSWASVVISGTTYKIPLYT